MIKILSSMFTVLKIVLLLACFVFSFFIIISMYQRLDKDIMKALFNFIPFLILFILFAINFIFKQKHVNQCLFYNITCCLVFSLILISAYRTFFDYNMIALTRLGYNMNFNYFADIIAPMRAMLYILSVSNVLLMIEGSSIKEEKVEIDNSNDKEISKSKKKKTEIELKPAK